MANIANNTYLFYGDKAELVKCHTALADLFQKVGSNDVCVDTAAPGIHAEWIIQVEDINPAQDDRFCMTTISKWYGNPLYWNNWVHAEFSGVSVAFRCEEAGCEIFEQVDPDHMFEDELVWICNPEISADELERLPDHIADYVYMNGSNPEDGYCMCGSFDKKLLFDDDFTPADLPDSFSYQEYKPYTYLQIKKEDALNTYIIASSIEQIVTKKPE